MTPVDTWFLKRLIAHRPIDPIVRGTFWTAVQLRAGYHGNPSKCPPIGVIWVSAGHHFGGHVYHRPEQVTVLLLTPHEGASIERGGLAEGGPFKTSFKTDLLVVRRLLKPEAVAAVGYQPVPKVGSATPPGYPRPNGEMTTGYYYPLDAEDPVL